MRSKFESRFKLTRIVSLFVAIPFASSALGDDTDLSLQLKADDVQGTIGERMELAGNVELVQGSLRVRADKISVVWKEEALEVVEAEGKPVRLEQLSNDAGTLVRAEANKIKYRIADAFVELVGNAKLTQDQNEVSGQLIRYDVKRGKIMAESSSSDQDQVEIIWRESETKSDAE